MSEDFRAFWSVIPATVLDDMSIPANAKILYGVLSSLMRREGYCWPSNAQLAEAMHCSEDVVKRWVSALAEAGHEIMNHSDTHPHFPQLSPEDMTRELNACSDKIEAITGVRPILFRPPYGDYDDKVVSTARAAGMYAVQWDVDSLDWKDPAPADITQRVLDRVQPGSIILFHNAAKNTPAALPSVLEGLIQKGYAIVPVSQLIYRENYTMDHTGRQCPSG